MNTRWMKRLLPFAATTCLVALSGCASAPEVNVDYDRAADFTQYKTFGFFTPLGTDRSNYQTIISERLKASTQRELEARGLRLDAGAPQLLVNFNAELNEKLRVSSMPIMGVGMGGGYYGYRVGMYGAYPMYFDQTTVTPYTEGTLNIDVVDAARRQLVWEGVIRSTVTQKTREDVQSAIDAAVAAAFAKFPVPRPAKAP